METVTMGLVLRRVKLGEADQILTILTPDQGLISASAKGSLRIKNQKKFGACGLFCYSEFTLDRGNKTWFVQEGQPVQVFHGISQSIEAMSLAMYLAELVMALPPIQGEDAPRTLRLLLNSFYLIDGGKKELRQIKAVFELRLMAQTGYLPDLLCCQACKRYDGTPFYFDLAGGSLLCADCAAKEGQAPNLDPGALVALRHICLVEDRKIFAFHLGPASQQNLSRVAEAYALLHVGKELRTLEFLHTVLP